MIIVVAHRIQNEKPNRIWLLTTVIFKWSIWPLTKTVKCHFGKREKMVDLVIKVSLFRKVRYFYFDKSSNIY